MKKIIGRLIAIIPAVLMQCLWYILILGILSKYKVFLNAVLLILSIVFVLYLISKRDESSYKILWLLIIFVQPILGTLLYILLGNKKTSRPLQKKLQTAEKNINLELESSPETIKRLECEDARTAQTFKYISGETHFPVTENSFMEYYPLGDDMFPAMCEELEKAERFIFLEYFIVQEGIFWNSLINILVKKAENGVDVRIMYDDLGSISKYSVLNALKLVSKKIKVVAFNPLLFVSARLNNRDHRKIMVIDGKTAFSGGINLADEYINQASRFGHWKDIGFKITGMGVQSYTYMFMEFWNAFSAEKIPDKYLDNSLFEKKGGDGYVISYYDSPFYRDAVSNNVFIDILSQSVKYVWFYTPYLILSDSLLDAFVRTAKRGVDVRIIMPGIPDKKVIFRLSRSYYEQLLEAGVKIYEYKSGFVHAKACISDDKLALIGTVNLDYRSLFLHFECSSLFYKSSAIFELKSDFEKTQIKCHERLLSEEKKGLIHRIINNILRIFAPLC